jgi:hypothetical protein
MQGWPPNAKPNRPRRQIAEPGRLHHEARGKRQPKWPVLFHGGLYEQVLDQSLPELNETHGGLTSPLNDSQLA